MKYNNLRQAKNTLVCSKCLRSIGLWLYRKDMADQSDEELSPASEKNKSYQLNDSFVFLNTDPYSDEILIKELLDGIVTKLETEEQTLLKSSMESPTKMPNSPSFLATTLSPLSPTINNQRKKRKIDQIMSSSNHNSEEQAESRKKLLDPLSEHFNWCPWLATTSNSVNSSTSVCQAFFRLIQSEDCKQTNEISDEEKNKQKALFAKSSSRSSLTTALNDDEDLIANSQILLKKVKSAQSLLINCTSQFSLSN